MSSLFFSAPPMRVNNDVGRASDLKIGGSAYGATIPEVFGSMRVEGNLIWAAAIQEVVAVTSSSQSTGGKGGGGGEVVTTTTNYSYFADFSIQLVRGPIYGVRKIWADAKLIYNLANDADAASIAASNALTPQLTIHLGGSTQSPDAVVEAVQGVGATPGYNNQAYITFNDLNITAAGARLPSMSYEVTQNGALYGGNQISRVKTSLASILQTLCQRAGLVSGQIDTSLLTQETDGFAIRSGSYRAAIEQLLDAYDIGARVSGNKVAFYPLDGVSEVTIDIGDLGARDGSGDPGDNSTLLKIMREQEVALPRMVQVTYLDNTRDYQPGTQTSQRQTGSAKGEVKISYDIAMSSAEAKQLADKKLFRAWIERVNYEFTLSAKYLRLESGNIITINNPTTGASYPMRLRKIQIGVNGVMACTAVAHDSAVLSQPAAGSNGQGGVSTIRTAGGTVAHLMNLPALLDNMNPDPYMFAAASGNIAWKGGVVYRATDGVTYAPIAELSTWATLGTADTVLATGQAQVWDTTNTVNVTLLKGVLASATDAQVLAGANAILLGDEIVQFTTATLIGANQYTLSRLLRGRKGTEWAMGTHAASERAVVLDASVAAIPMQLSLINGPMSYKVVPYGLTLADASPVTFTATGENLMPYSGVQPRGARDGSSNLTITWVRRGRLGRELMSGTDIPLSEVTEAYDIDIMNGATVVRTLTSITPSVAYTSAMQITDFGSNQSSVTAKIYQRSASVGRGRVLTATI